VKGTEIEDRSKRRFPTEPSTQAMNGLNRAALKIWLSGKFVSLTGERDVPRVRGQNSTNHYHQKREKTLKPQHVNKPPGEQLGVWLGT
jgi:hypothetical protein